LQTLMIFQVDVIGLRTDTPLQSSGNILDVDGNQFVTPFDAWRIINTTTALNSSSIPASQISDQSQKVDVNGDNFVDPLDAVTVSDAINYQFWVNDPTALALG
nr:dockerin type I domain-containing protein [Pirellula sp.]